MSEARSAKPAPPRLRSVPIERSLPDAVALAPAWDLLRPLTSLIGRDAAAIAARALLVDHGVRLLTLTGPGGVGKTRLALRIAEDAAAAFPDGVAFVPLAAIADPDLVMPTIARELGLREIGALAPLDLIADFLRQQRHLLVLDNFEQVRPAATHLATLLAACPDLTILVTSRIPLHISGEQRFPVSPLALPEDEMEDGGRRVEVDAYPSPAVDLYVARARAIDPRFTLDAGNAAAVAAICRHLDGRPLAIELAAARIKMLSPRELRARLDRTLPYFGDGPVDAPPRLRTMRDAIAWSYELLSPEEQVLLRRLAVFVGGFTLEAAEYVGGKRGKGDRGVDAEGRRSVQLAESPNRRIADLLSPFPPPTSISSVSWSTNPAAWPTTWASARPIRTSASTKSRAVEQPALVTAPRAKLVSAVLWAGSASTVRRTRTVSRTLDQGRPVSSAQDARPLAVPPAIPRSLRRDLLATRRLRVLCVAAANGNSLAPQARGERCCVQEAVLPRSSFG